MCSPRKSNENFSIFTFYESKQMSLTQDLRWSLGRSIALQLQRQTDLLLCTINCFLQWDHLPNMAVGDLAFYYTLYARGCPWTRDGWVPHWLRNACAKCKKSNRGTRASLAAWGPGARLRGPGGVQGAKPPGSSGAFQCGYSISNANLYIYVRLLS